MRLLTMLIAGIALLTALSASGQPRSALAEPLLFLDDAGPIILYDRPLCSLLNENAAAASIAGQDGGASIEVDGTSYFIFSDTSFLGNPEDVSFAPNTIATSTDTDPTDCIDMQYKVTNGIARPLLPQLPDETTLWPDGLIQAPNGDIWFFAGSVTPGPSEWWVQGVTLGRLDPATLGAIRENVMMWDEGNPFPLGHVIGIRGTVVVDGMAYAMMHTGENAIYLGRVPLASVPDVAAYEYWTGAAWSPSMTSATPLWVQSDGFNGASVQWSEALQTWMAIYTPEQGRHVRVRTAPALTGPWSSETEWIDCARYIAPWVHPMCYSAAFHPQYDRDGGRTMTISFSTYVPYEVVLHEIRLATPIYSWRNAAGETRLQPQSPGAGFTQEGIALYASDIPAPGLSGVHRFVRSNGEHLYAFTYSEAGVQDMGIAFYASPTADPDGANVTYDPVYRWDKGAQHLYSPLQGLAELGYTRSAPPFFGLCGDADSDTASDCVEAAQGTDPGIMDTDGDGFGDRVAGLANPNTVAKADNCPLVANPSQGNIDGEPLFVTTGVQDGTNPKADALGDACDSDRDGDGLTNTAETAAGTSPDVADTDGDFWPDRVETRCSSNPLDPASKPTGADTDGDRLPDLCEIRLFSIPTLKDSDGDGMNDYVEVRWLSSPRDTDSDDDGWDDTCEIASVNLDHGVNAIDLSLIARRFGMTGIAGRPGDLNRDGIVQVTDLVLAATNFGPCA